MDNRQEVVVLSFHISLDPTVSQLVPLGAILGASTARLRALLDL